MPRFKRLCLTHAHCVSLGGHVDPGLIVLEPRAAQELQHLCRVSPRAQDDQCPTRRRPGSGRSSPSPRDEVGEPEERQETQQKKKEHAEGVWLTTRARAQIYVLVPVYTSPALFVIAHVQQYVALETFIEYR